MLDVNKFRFNQNGTENTRNSRIEKISARAIAIIGMSGRFAGCNNPEEFWHHLREGHDLVRPFPESRRSDTDRYLKMKGYEPSAMIYSEGGYLEEIDRFDPQFFKIPPKEASLMDPHQRIFLETAWHALEEAGYGGKKLSGSNTGVYVGFSSDFGSEYKELVQEMERESQALSLGGNIKSIIASRISYILNWHGPSVVVDTACSSSLTAIHMACRALRGGECDQALAGSVKCKLLPLKGQEGIGIRSSIDRARTFDNASDGTGSGEGCAAVLLKPLSRALEDGDRILAVIKGSALNQDGTSNGITAPNPLAQADVLQRAWKDAGIDPETISYIEAHGTGTRLGDPIEIDGITRAFQPYTDRKQFCGIGAAKTNTGHLDHAAGMVGIVKAVLALRHGELPPTVHFQQPNREIPFPDSPVYIVERLTPWAADGGPRRCGVSAFGLSGTNCHIILEEAPQPTRAEPVPAAENPAERWLAISAPKEAALRRLTEAYYPFLRETAADPGDICYTANTGRGHYSHRLLIQFHDREELTEQILLLCRTADWADMHRPGIFYSGYRVTDEERSRLTEKADDSLRRLGPTEELIDLYIAGADVDWERVYQNRKHAKTDLPLYPFERKRCWVEWKEQNAVPSLQASVPVHPLIDRLYEETAEETVYRTEFSVDRQWELADHRVTGFHVLPGTGYLEMARVVSKGVYPEAIEIRDLVFLSPLALASGESREVHTCLRQADGYHEFNVISPDIHGTGWITHVDGKIAPLPAPETRQYDLEMIKTRCPNVFPARYSDTPRKRAIEVGPHWKNVNTYYIGEEEMLVHLTLQEQYLSDLEGYTIYPSLLDSAVNAANQSIGEGLYLPFSYHSLRLLRRMPANIYSHIRKRPAENTGLETVAFDITLMDETGHAFIEIEDYKIKKVRTQTLQTDHQELYHAMHWVPKAGKPGQGIKTEGATLFFTDGNERTEAVAEQLRGEGVRLITVRYGHEFAKMGPDQFMITDTAADYEALCHILVSAEVRRVIHMTNLDGDGASLSRQSHRAGQLFHLSRGMMAAHWPGQIELILIGENTYTVTGKEAELHPCHAAMFGLAKVLPAELSQFRIRTIDMDTGTPAGAVIDELRYDEASFQTAYRQGERYVEEFCKVEPEYLPEAEYELREEGVYLITGGTGALGLAVSRYLASQKPVHLALIQRTPVPPRGEWDAILSQDDNPKLQSRILALKELEELGADVTCAAADLTDEECMIETLQSLRDRYGRIRGIIHCAGIAGDGFILRKTETAFRAVLAPKIEGTWLLDRLTREDRPDFFILFSSVNAHYGRPGQGDYTAANAYMDSFAAYRQRSGLRTLSINWAPWKEIGMAVEYGVNDARGIFKALPTEVALQAFGEMLHRDTTGITVGELNYELLSALESEFPFELSGSIRTQIRRHRKLHRKADEPVAETKPGAPVIVKGSEAGNGLEMQVAQIWADVLGLEEVDVYESFYDLGGDSIMATYILKEMEKHFPGKVDISNVFTYSSVHAMTEFLAARLAAPVQKKAEAAAAAGLDDDLDSMLDQLLDGTLNANEAEQLLMSKLGGDQ